SDAFRRFTDFEYGRANLPITIHKEAAQDEADKFNYYYNVNDQRFVKELLDVDDQNPSIAEILHTEYYWQDASGRDIATSAQVLSEHDFNVDWTYYLFGNQRYGKFSPDSTQQPNYDPNLIGNRLLVDTSDVLIQQVIDILQAGSFPMDIVTGTMGNGDQWAFLKTYYENYIQPDTTISFTVSQYLNMRNENQLIQLEKGTSGTLSISLGDLIDGGVGDPTYRANQADYGVYQLLSDSLLPITQFYIQDHLGNTRIVYEDTPCGTSEKYTILYAGDYYPYGKIIREFSGADGVEKYLSTFHERDKESNLDFRGARFYDADIASFQSLDPLADDFYSINPYLFALANPVKFNDPDGKAPTDPVKKGLLGNSALSVGGPTPIPSYNLANYTTIWDNTEYNTTDNDSYAYLAGDPRLSFDEPANMITPMEYRIGAGNDAVGFSMRIYHYKLTIDENLNLGRGFNEVSLNATYYKKIGSTPLSLAMGGGVGPMMSEIKNHDHSPGFVDRVGPKIGNFEAVGVGASTHLGLVFHDKIPIKGPVSLSWEMNVSMQAGAQSTATLKSTSFSGNTLFNQPYQRVGRGFYGGASLFLNF
ncbi:MAG: hypothetical protein KDC12_13495, partial [Flavobacteriales bacterium]|nr:hypothetical protein [Flavobacteriales bacterium]